jgi:hypothetical protein
VQHCFCKSGRIGPARGGAALCRSRSGVVNAVDVDLDRDEPIDAIGIGIDGYGSVEAVIADRNNNGTLGLRGEDTDNDGRLDTYGLEEIATERLIPWVLTTTKKNDSMTSPRVMPLRRSRILAL